MTLLSSLYSRYSPSDSLRDSALAGGHDEPPQECNTEGAGAGEVSEGALPLVAALLLLRGEARLLGYCAVVAGSGRKADDRYRGLGERRQAPTEDTMKGRISPTLRQVLDDVEARKKLVGLLRQRKEGPIQVKETTVQLKYPLENKRLRGTR